MISAPEFWGRHRHLPPGTWIPPEKAKSTSGIRTKSSPEGARKFFWCFSPPLEVPGGWNVEPRRGEKFFLLFLTRLRVAVRINVEPRRGGFFFANCLSLVGHEWGAWKGRGFFFGRLGNYVWASRRGGVVIPASFFHVGSVILWGGRVGQRLPQGRFGGGQVFVHSGGRLCGGWLRTQAGIWKLRRCWVRLGWCAWCAPLQDQDPEQAPDGRPPHTRVRPAELKKSKPDGQTERRAQTLTCTDDHWTLWKERFFAAKRRKKIWAAPADKIFESSHSECRSKKKKPGRIRWRSKTAPDPKWHRHRHPNPG